MGFYLGRGVTWVVCFNGCGLPRLVCFSESYFAFLILCLCSGGTWVHVVTEKDLLGLNCICGVCCSLPMFWWYLGTCYDQKGSTWVNLHLWGLL